MILTAVIHLSYLISAIGFIIGLGRMGLPSTARSGNLIASVSMGIAILATIFYPGNLPLTGTKLSIIIGAMVIGSAIGLTASRRVKMTAMPQLVSIFNGFGGASAVCVSIAELVKIQQTELANSLSAVGIALFTMVIGAVTFTGSMLAYLKLDGKVNDKNVVLPFHQWFNTILMLGLLVFTVYTGVVFEQVSFTLLVLLLVVSLLYGWSFVAPIGGADMPVVISLLNSLTGLTAMAAGFIYGNNVMILGGALVGAAGTILTILMCEAMNRSLFNVIVGSFGGVSVDEDRQSEDGVVKEIAKTDLAILMKYAKRVIIVPGYGLAVAQAQKLCKEIEDELAENDVEVLYAIHPVAGRMPGHMNVLLAEADVPYDRLIELEDANKLFPGTDVSLVIGANDVVNPSALDSPGSPIYGMPVLHVWDSKKTVVFKRSMRPGYAGIQNPLFFKDKTNLYFGDAKASLSELLKELKSM